MNTFLNFSSHALNNVTMFSYGIDLQQFLYSSSNSSSISKMTPLLCGIVTANSKYCGCVSTKSIITNSRNVISNYSIAILRPSTKAPNLEKFLSTLICQNFHHTPISKTFFFSFRSTR